MTTSFLFSSLLRSLSIAIIGSLLFSLPSLFAQLTSQQKAEYKAAVIAEGKHHKGRVAAIETAFASEKRRLLIERREALSRELAGVTDRARGKQLRQQAALDEAKIAETVAAKRKADLEAEADAYRYNLANIKASYGIK